MLTGATDFSQYSVQSPSLRSTVSNTVPPSLVTEKSVDGCHSTGSTPLPNEHNNSKKNVEREGGNRKLRNKGLRKAWTRRVEGVLHTFVKHVALSGMFFFCVSVVFHLSVRGSEEAYQPCRRTGTRHDSNVMFTLLGYDTEEERPIRRR